MSRQAMTHCDHCGKWAKCTLDCDPFLVEVWGLDAEEDDSWWCDDCWDERKAQI